MCILTLVFDRVQKTDLGFACIIFDPCPRGFEQIPPLAILHYIKHNGVTYLCTAMWRGYVNAAENEPSQ
jgi:hypothetical protein